MATLRHTAQAGVFTTGLAGWSGTAWSATGANGGTVALLLAAAVGGAIAIASAAVLLRHRQRAQATPLQQVLTTATCGWWRTDPAGRLVDVHPGQRMPAADGALARGTLLWEIAGDDGAAAEALRGPFVARQPFANVVLAPSAGPSLALSGGPVFTGGGAFAGFSGVVLPGGGVTAAAVATAPQDELQADLDDSRRQLGERTRELDNTVRELDSFAYSVSHDLRAPLRVVDGFATIVLEDYGDRGKPLDDVGRDHLRRIVAASQRMNTMIDTLLGLSRMTGRELTRERIDLSHIARELADDLKAQDSNRAVEFEIQPNLRTDGDSTLLRLVLQNLLGNAYKFTAKSRAARIEFGARQDVDGLAYYVKDNGAGFDMRFAEKMFGLFQRMHSANEFPGTGVGLATVQKIVRRHGGRVWGEAIPAPNDGHGATLYFTLWEKP